MPAADPMSETHSPKENTTSGRRSEDRVEHFAVSNFRSARRILAPLGNGAGMGTARMPIEPDAF